MAHPTVAAGLQPKKRQTSQKPHKVLISKRIAKCNTFVIRNCFSDVCNGGKKVWCSLNYIRHNFFYIGHSFSYVRYNFRRVWFAPFVGAYCIRPVCHRMKCIGKHRRNFAKSTQFRAYAIRPYSGAIYWLNANCAFVRRHNLFFGNMLRTPNAF